jgi:hypothetical protein
MNSCAGMIHQAANGYFRRSGAFETGYARYSCGVEGDAGEPVVVPSQKIKEDPPAERWLRRALVGRGSTALAKFRDHRHERRVEGGGVGLASFWCPKPDRHCCYVDVIQREECFIHSTALVKRDLKRYIQEVGCGLFMRAGGAGQSLGNLVTNDRDVAVCHFVFLGWGCLFDPELCCWVEVGVFPANCFVHEGGKETEFKQCCIRGKRFGFSTPEMALFPPRHVADAGGACEHSWVFNFLLGKIFNEPIPAVDVSLQGAWGCCVDLLDVVWHPCLPAGLRADPGLSLFEGVGGNQLQGGTVCGLCSNPEFSGPSGSFSCLGIPVFDPPVRGLLLFVEACHKYVQLCLPPQTVAIEMSFYRMFINTFAHMIPGLLTHGFGISVCRRLIVNGLTGQYASGMPLTRGWTVICRWGGRLLNRIKEGYRLNSLVPPAFGFDGGCV